MLKRIKTLLKDNILAIAISATLAIACASLIKVPKTTFEISHLDKMLHSLAYFVLGICWLLSFRNSKSNTKRAILFFCILFGIILEFLQGSLTIYRTGDYLDALANTMGVVLAFLFFNWFFQKKSN